MIIVVAGRRRVGRNGDKIAAYDVFPDSYAFAAALGQAPQA